MAIYDPISCTRSLIDIESISGNERAVGEWLAQQLEQLGYGVERIVCTPQRFNVFALPLGISQPDLVLSTHMDTVPPFIASREDGEKIYGRGSCDAKGIIAAQIAAAEQLRHMDIKVGLLFLVGEELDSLGARTANQFPRGSRFLINGEPTDNRIAIASKGALRVEIEATGRMAHSAYPHLGDSAIEKLVHALERLIAMDLPRHPEFGPCTMNIGTISGGRAPNVIPDQAHAELLYRLVGGSVGLREQILSAVGELATADVTLEIPFVKLREIDGLPTMLAAFTTDIPALTNWGEPVLLGPGSIHVAHTTREFLSKRELFDAVDLYVRVAKQLLS
ncbi:MAG: M20/M25/M40 family metallo-hydrolase [Acidobacteriaceae bacterium]